METSQKILLTLTVIGLAIGIPVTFSHAEAAPAWTLALPLGAVCLGLFLLSRLWRKEIAKLDEDERLRMESARRYRSSVADTGNGPRA